MNITDLSKVSSLNSKIENASKRLRSVNGDRITTVTMYSATAGGIMLNLPEDKLAIVKAVFAEVISAEISSAREELVKLGVTL